MKKRTSDFTLPPLDDLFSSQAERDDAKLERVREIPSEELHPFKEHPFKIQSGEEMDRMIESIRKYGTLTPGLARPSPEGGYELVSGHRRLAACQALGMETMPVIVRDMTDDEAVIAMVDANLQRETILPSEKAFAYKMKLEALNHQGVACGQVGHKSRDNISEGDSGRQVQRYIRLTYLHPELLSRVDDGKIAFSPAVELSYLTKQEQAELWDIMQSEACTPSLSQAVRMKKLSQKAELTPEAIFDIMSEEKANQKERVRLEVSAIRKYFPRSYTPRQMEESIVKMLEAQYRKRQRDRER